MAIPLVTIPLGATPGDLQSVFNWLITQINLNLSPSGGQPYNPSGPY